MNKAHQHRTDILLLVALCVFLVGTLTWASVAEVELAAVAPGRIVPTGQVKVIRSFEAGKIRRIAVEEGSPVRHDDVLIEFDTTLVDAEISKRTAELQTRSVEAARLEALVAWRDNRAFRPPAGAPPEIVSINRDLLADQVASHRAHLQELDNRMAERRAQVRTLEAALAKHRRLLPILRERTAMRETLYRNNHGSRLAVIDEQERLVELEGNVALRERELAEAGAALAALRAQKERTVSEFYRERRAALATLRERMLVLREDIRQARELRARHTLRAPVDGVVQDLAVHTEDGMVEPGARLMVIVPRNAGIQVEAFIANADIGFVKPGQRVTLKVATFDFRRYGAIEGTVRHIGKDAVDAGAQGGGSLFAGVAVGVSGAAAAQPGTAQGGPAFKALIDLDQTYMEVEGRKIGLLPGMSSEAAVILGKQRLIEYVLQPLRGYRQDAFRER
ncbi:MAG: HlyD family type I secretion periplasmic adaptor subunit [Deltaproteobacteria bacterium]|nr:HlyD family type I secretion periplasmic adaptor subunit [Deltaproteobacteria bacterium]